MMKGGGGKYATILELQCPLVSAYFSCSKARECTEENLSDYYLNEGEGGAFASVNDAFRRKPASLKSEIKPRGCVT